jgi:hypothetical protein
MADQNYPQIPSAVWWKLRDAFKRTIPTKVTDTYLTSILNVKDTAARGYLRDLKVIGLVSEEGAPAEIVFDWRDDEKYPAAAKRIFESVYPDELRASAPAPDPERKRVVRWFMQVGRIGEGAAGNKAAFYTLLASGELQKSVPTQKPDPNKSERPKIAAGSQKATQTEERRTTPPAHNPTPKTTIEPNIQLNVQIHISADATSEQIDAIFASMATHLRR